MELEIRSDNNIAGDPAVKVVKELRVDYALDGAAMSITVAEKPDAAVAVWRRRLGPPAPRLVLENGQFCLIVAEQASTVCYRFGGEKTVTLMRFRSSPNNRARGK